MNSRFSKLALQASDLWPIPKRLLEPMYSMKTSEQIGHYHGCNPLLLLHFAHHAHMFCKQTPNCETKLSAIAHAAAAVYHHINLKPNLTEHSLRSTVREAVISITGIQSSSSSFSDLCQLFPAAKSRLRMVNEFQKALSRVTTSREGIPR